jgi:hypothetical protein
MLDGNEFDPGNDTERGHMSQLIEQAIQKVKLLPEQDQESIASIILQEIESEHRWEELFARPESADLLSRMADEALADAREGRARKLDLNEL